MRLLHAGHRRLAACAVACRAQSVGADIERQLQGNLCRCTGYEPIVKAAIAAAATIPDADNDRLVAAYDATTEALTEMADGARVTIEHKRGISFVPARS
jgi:xanthine dehydrogenase small subunit